MYSQAAFRDCAGGDGHPFLARTSLSRARSAQPRAAPRPWGAANRPPALTAIHVTREERSGKMAVSVLVVSSFPLLAEGVAALLRRDGRLAVRVVEIPPGGWGDPAL